jgi:hypothetical protein
MKFKTLFLILVVTSLSITSKSQTIFKLNQYNIVYDGKFMPIFTHYSGQSFSKNWGISAYFYVNATQGSSWGEGLVGPTYTPVKGLSFSFLAGFQTNEEQIFRISPIINYSGKKASGFAAFEYGGERHRWDIMAFYHVNKFKFGAEMIRFYQMYAAGPRVEYSFFKKQPFTVFYSGMWDWVNGKPVSMFGIYSTFGLKK